MVASFTSRADGTGLDIGTDANASGVLQAAGLLVFEFADYVRTATPGEEDRDPACTTAAASPPRRSARASCTY